MPSATIFHKFERIPWNLQRFCLLKLFFVNLWWFFENWTRIFTIYSFSVSASFLCFCSLKLSSVVRSATSRELLTLIYWAYDGLLPHGSFLRGSFESMMDNSPSVVKSLCQNSLKVHEDLRYLRIVLLSSLCEEAYYCSSDTMINSEARDAERKE